MDATSEAQELGPKARRTRAAILQSAIELLGEVGYERATMRAIAERAGVSTGNAYYYFRSKEALVQAFYARTHAEHLTVARPRLAAARGLRDRLLATMSAKLETIEPYHPFAGVLFRSAADPGSPLNPFSEDSRAVREDAIELFREVVVGMRKPLPKDLTAELPQLLWTWHMGILLYWVHDESEGRAKTWRLMEESSALIASAVKLSGLPLIAPLRRKLLKLVRELTAGAA
jgi:AcrR family transcriptional regulator